MAVSLPHRCSRDSCRKRYTFSKHWEEFKRVKICTCGCKKFTVCYDRLRAAKRDKCNCSGYHFPHREGSKFCTSNSMSSYHAAKERHGMTGDELLEVFTECTWQNEGGRAAVDPPF